MVCMGKKALAVISHGTVAEAKGYTNVRDTLMHTFPDYDIFEAYTSPRVIARLARERGIYMPSCAQLFKQLCDLGYREVACQSLHIIPGSEYEKILEQMKSYAYRFDCMTAGVPLLWDRWDLGACVDALRHNAPCCDKQEALIWIGHGSQNAADIRYEMLGDMLRQQENQFVSTLERGWRSVLPLLGARNIKTVQLMPLMLTAARHFERDIAGAGDSWKTGLLSAGYTVSVQRKGLGEYPEISDIFCRHFRESLGVDRTVEGSLS